MAFTTIPFDRYGGATGIDLVVAPGPHGPEATFSIFGALIESKQYDDGLPFTVSIGTGEDAGAIRFAQCGGRNTVPLRVERYRGYALTGRLKIGAALLHLPTGAAGAVPWHRVTEDVIELDLRVFQACADLGPAPALADDLQGTLSADEDGELVVMPYDEDEPAPVADRPCTDDADDPYEPAGRSLAVIDGASDGAGEGEGGDEEADELTDAAVVPPEGLTAAERVVFDVLAAEVGIYMTSLEIGDRIGDITGIPATGTAVLMRVRGMRDKLPPAMTLETSKGSGIRLLVASGKVRAAA